MSHHRLFTRSFTTLLIVVCLASCESTLATTYSVSYDGNGSDGGSVPVDAGAYEEMASVTILDNTGKLVKTGYNFGGWNTAVDGKGTSYAAGSSLTMGSANVTLYALWTAVPTYLVSYDGNGATGGTAPKDSGSYAAGAKVTVLGNAGKLVKAGYNFSGWNAAKDGKGKSYAAGASLTMGSANVTLYAQWSKSLDVTVVVPGAVTVTLTTDSAVALGNPISASVTTSTTVDSYAWYLDGAIVSGQAAAAFSGGSDLAKGPHTLMVAMKKGAVIYSASHSVKVQ